MNPNILLVSTALLLLPAAAVAQCAYPAVPQGGFALTRDLNQLVTYGDTAMTRMDVRYPSASPGSCGWPVIILVHGLGGNRAGMKDDAEYLATQGYVTVTYDVRGQGDALTLNPASLGTEAIGRSERLDLAEIVAIVKSCWRAPFPLSGSSRSWESAGCQRTQGILRGRRRPAT